MQAARSVEGDPRAALEEAKAAVESQDEEAAHRHLGRGDLVGLGRWAPRTRAEDPRTLAYLVDAPEGR